VRAKNASFAKPFYTQKRSFCQDRLGTNTGKPQEELRFFAVIPLVIYALKRNFKAASASFAAQQLADGSMREFENPTAAGSATFDKEDDEGETSPSANAAADTFDTEN
jgi:hypothetical protein